MDAVRYQYVCLPALVLRAHAGCVRSKDVEIRLFDSDEWGHPTVTLTQSLITLVELAVMQFNSIIVDKGNVSHVQSQLGNSALIIM